MPPLTLHIATARGAATRTGTGVIEGELGNLYLGSTAPDVRVITRWDRARTHFFDLDEFSEQDGVTGFFAAYPELAKPETLEPKTAAFVAGYLTHLAMDELWINMVYRPYFGARSPLGGGLKANVMDRALQFSLDSDRRHDSELVAHVTEAVARCDLCLDIGLFDSDTLRHWHRVVLDVISKPADWERFRSGARRHIGVTDGDGEEFENLVRDLPDLVEETLRYLTPQRVDAFMK